ncbi:WASH complex subunit 2-like isoform X2 [Limulus polyphemus]|uniref:WASH complex subunit 2-like isoform X2 n=1 Tax=Limulus polyphemus TaxID=6850 RepID=A0ABM1T1Z8_LIMPO|nr:WASH complex subunit 2-like isoform X2 [Limulus polyphemus]
MAVRETPTVVLSETNGPVFADNGEESNQIWEYPWATDIMRQHSRNWTLAGDSGLLNFLQDFSQRMISTTHEMEKTVDGLLHEAKVTGVRVSNIVNDFTMLSNTQFVENRVYDEEIQEEPIIEPKRTDDQKTKEQREAELIPKITLALKLGLEVVEKAFHHVEVQQESDSEDEEMPENTELVLEVRDPYLHRSLPHIIGSDAFHHDEHVGLLDLLSEEEEKSSVEEYESEASKESESDFEEGKRKEQDWITKEQNTKRLSVSSESSESSKSDSSELFRDREEYISNSSFSISDEDIIKADDKRKKIPEKSAIKSEVEAVRSGTATKQYTNNKIEQKGEEDRNSKNEEELFGKEEEDDLGFSAFETKAGLFAGTGQLFDNDKDEESLFADTKKSLSEEVGEQEEEEKLIGPRKRGNTKSGKKIPVGGISVFGGDEAFFGLQGSLKQTDDSLQTKRTLTASDKPKDIFDDESDEGDDIFGSLGKPSKQTTSGLSKKSTELEKPDTKGLFDGDDEDLFGIKNISSEETLVQQSPQVTVIQSTDKVSRPEPISQSDSVPSNSLFAEETDNDDLFALSQDSKPKTKLSGKHLFDEVVTSVGQKETVKKDISPEQTLSKDEGLFIESVESDLFSAVAKPSSRKNTGGISLFEDEKLFNETNSTSKDKSEETQKSTAVITSPTKKRTTTIVSLFEDDEDEDNDGLFSPVNASKEINTQSVKSKPRSKSMFEDEDILFGGPAKESPEVDLFAVDIPSSEPAQTSSSKIVNSKANSTLTTASRNLDRKLEGSTNKPAGGVALFGGINVLGESVYDQDRSPNKYTIDETCSSDTLETVQETKKAPPLKDTKNISVSFDEPADTSNTLITTNKDRVRIQSKRRPPSRKGRHAAVRHSQIHVDVVDGENGSEELIASLTEENPPISSFLAPPKPVNSGFLKSPSTEEEDIFSVAESPVKSQEQDIFDLFTPSKSSDSASIESGLFGKTSPIISSNLKDSSVQQDAHPPKVGDSRKNDIFAEITSPSVSRINIFSESEPLFSDDGKFSSQLSAGFEKDTLSYADKHTSKAEKETSDISVKIDKQTSSKLPQGTTVDIFADTEDDIFLNLPSIKSPKPTISQSSLLFDSDGSDDIFATPPTTTKSKNKPKEIISKKKNILKSDNTVSFVDPLLGEKQDVL